MYTFDHALFLTLNFDGGPVMDRIMVLCSTPAAWAWLYVVMLWLVWRRGGWRALLLFAVTAGAALGLADMVAGIFKHAGLLGSLWPSFPARLRPMHTPSLEGLVHTVREGGLYGTVSAHAATMTALCVTALPAVRRRPYGGVSAVRSRGANGGRRCETLKNLLFFDNMVMRSCDFLRKKLFFCRLLTKFEKFDL